MNMDLNAMVKIYNEVFFKYLDAEENYYKNMTPHKAIEQAAGGMASSKKMNGHQRRIGKIRCKDGGSVLLKSEKYIEKCKSFEEIFVFTEEVRVKKDGLGNLWSYDTALRIGFSLGLYPTDIYLQSGALSGALLLLKPINNFGRKISIDQFPTEIQTSLKPYQIENFLCVGDNPKRDWFR
jgi:hypothetical protein